MFKFFVTLFALLASSLPLSSSLCQKSDEIALFKIKRSFGESPVLRSWNAPTDCCSWAGVDCNSTGSVTSLRLSSSAISGPIPHSIAHLRALTALTLLNLPNLSGHVPHFLTKLPLLAELTISGTSVSGRIPSSLCHVPNLVSLDFSKNKLNGAIPDCLAKNCYKLDLSENMLTGPIPPSLMINTAKGSFPTLNLRKNQLTGTIPRSFRKIDFDIIDLSRNRLRGDASFLFGASRLMHAIDLSWNELEFDLSVVEFPRTVATLDLSHNRIRGSIPRQVAELTKLGLFGNRFDVSYNRLCGRIPTGGLMSTFGRSAYAHNRCLCGAPLWSCSRL